ncbi:hypothetical protein ASJ81_03615 [Methanosarcina spelaei]|uniref:Uncharacterized protein n=1 Tax=Methanosarcina spelaei TaxID=1036679 RepID=A0A2A2HW88_9EURY|nr:hypothetical protein [Methanosarcina spelaei]PAV13555.1 hypothetical protein ASJ81_03615 [Methanosarcina spelaei]
MNPKEIKFDEVKEKWNFYKLSDGATLKLKIVLVKVIKEGQDSRGNTSLGFQVTNVVGVTPTDDMIGSTSLGKDEYVEVTSSDEDWNEYNLEKDVTLMIKPFISQVIRTGEFDSKKIPIYVVQAQPLIKHKLKSR